MGFIADLGSIGGALSGASAFMGSLNQMFSGNDYQRQADQAYVRQREMMKENNRFQADENQKSRDFTSQMYDKQWSDYTNYNSYYSMVNRAKDAGVSPAALFQSGAPSSIGGISPATVGHSASPSPSYADIVNPVNRQAETFHSVAQGLQALSQASKLGFETTQIVPLMSAQIKNQLSAAGLNDIRQKSEDFELGLRNIYGKKLYDSELGKNYSQMINAYSQAYLYAEQGNTQESIRELNKADRLYKDSLRISTDKQVEFMNLQMSWYPREMRAKINNLNSSAAESSSNAKLNDLQYEINRNMQGALEGSIFDSWQNKIKEGKILDWQIDVAQAAAKEAGVRASHAELLFWKDFVLDVMSHGVGAFVSYKNARSWSILSKSSQSDVARKIQEMQYKYGDKFSTEQDFGNGYRERTESYEPRSH